MPDRTRGLLGGMLWLSIGRLTAQGASTLSSFVLAAFLTPAEFGTVGAALLLVSFVNSLTEAGARQFIVTLPKKQTGLSASSWGFEIVRGAVAAIGIFVLAHPAMTYLGYSEAVAYARALALVPLLRFSANVGVHLREREHNFEPAALQQVSTAVAQVIVSVACVLVLRNAWAIVAGAIAGAMVHFVASFVLAPTPGLPSFFVGWGRVFGFGKWLMLTGIVYFFAQEGDKIFVAATMRAEDFGPYKLAASAVNIGLVQLIKVVQRVTFSANSQSVRNGTFTFASFRSRYLAFATTGSAIGALSAIIVPPVVILVLGSEWRITGLAITYLSVAFALKSLVQAFGGVLTSYRKPHLEFAAELLRATVLIGGLFMLPEGAAIPAVVLVIAASDLCRLIFRFGMIGTVEIGADKKANWSLLFEAVTAVAFVMLPSILLLAAAENVSSRILFRFSLVLGVMVTSYLLYLWKGTGPLLILRRLRTQKRSG